MKYRVVMLLLVLGAVFAQRHATFQAFFREGSVVPAGRSAFHAVAGERYGPLCLERKATAPLFRAAPGRANPCRIALRVMRMFSVKPQQYRGTVRLLP
jgi:hypothetical protein